MDVDEVMKKYLDDFSFVDPKLPGKLLLHIKAQDAEIAIAHARITEFSPANPGETLLDAVNRVGAEIERLRAVVAVYADTDNWDDDCTYWFNRVWVPNESGHTRAAKALKGGE